MRIDVQKSQEDYELKAIRKDVASTPSFHY